jgi:ribosomal protein L20A (L18A)
MSEWHAAKANYNTANSIVRSKVSIETIDESDPEYINNNMIHILQTENESPIDIGEFIESV